MGLFSKPNKKTWGPSDHIGHACTRYGMYITQNLTMSKDDPHQKQIGNYFQSIVGWLEHYRVGGLSGYYQSMFEIGCISKKFEAVWTPGQVTEAKDKYLKDSESVKDALMHYMSRSSTEEEVTRSIIQAMGRSPDGKGNLDEFEESWLYVVNSLTLDLCDQHLRGNIDDDPLQGAVTTGFLGCLVISCYREYKV